MNAIPAGPATALIIVAVIIIVIILMARLLRKFSQYAREESNEYTAPAAGKPDAAEGPPSGAVPLDLRKPAAQENDAAEREEDAVAAIIAAIAFDMGVPPERLVVRSFVKDKIWKINTIINY